MDMSSLPPGVVPPAMQPPPGEISNFVDPETRGPMYIAVATIFMGLATIFVMVRLWARLYIQRKPWWDDLITVVALFFQAAYCGVNMWLCLNGVGTQLWNVPATAVMPLINPARVMAALTEPAIGFTKLALLFFYYHLFWPNLATRVGSLIGIVAVTIIYTTLFFMFIFMEVTQTVALNKSIGILNVFTDFYILLLPLPAVLNLQLASNKKIGLIILFSTGLFCCIMSIVGAYYRWAFANNGANFTGDLLNVILVNTIECSVGIMCACVPLFPAVLGTGPLSANWLTTLRTFADRLLSSRGSGRSRDTVNDSYSRVKDPVSGNYEMGPATGSLRTTSNRSLVHQTSMDKDEVYVIENNATVSQAKHGQFGASATPGSIEVRKEFRVEAERQPPHAR